MKCPIMYYIHNSLKNNKVSANLLRPIADMDKILIPNTKVNSKNKNIEINTNYIDPNFNPSQKGGDNVEVTNGNTLSRIT